MQNSTILTRLYEPKQSICYISLSMVSSNRNQSVAHGDNMCSDCGCEQIIFGFCDECGNYMHNIMHLRAVAEDYSVDLDWGDQA